MTRTTSSRHLSFPALVLSALLLTACGAGDATPDSPAGDGAPVAGGMGGSSSGQETVAPATEVADPADPGPDQVPADDGVPAEIPQPQGGWERTVVAASDNEWLVVYSKDDVTAEECDAYLAQFAGWTEETMTDTGDGFAAMFNNGTWTVFTGCTVPGGVTQQIAPYSM